MALRDFEQEIVETFRLAGRRTPRVGVWIRGHLLDVKFDYLYGMWKSYTEFVRDARRMGAKLDEVSYRNFRTYSFFLKKLNLIRTADPYEVAQFFKSYPSQSKGKPRRYLTLVEENLNHPAWLDPVGYYVSSRSKLGGE